MRRYKYYRLKKTIAFIEKYFTSMDNWKDDFIATAKVSRGWAVLSFDQRSNKLRNISMDSYDLGDIAYSSPILVLDMYKHACFLQYADKKLDYINQFMKNTNWNVIGARLIISLKLTALYETIVKLPFNIVPIRIHPTS
jgi:Fe-Mn family superoxide dismutase